MYIDIKIKWRYGEKSGEFITTFGYPEFTREDIQFKFDSGYWSWYINGNGACDCNRSTMTGLTDYDNHFPCGETIEFLEFTPLPETIREVDAIGGMRA